MISKGERVKIMVALGIAVDLAVAAADAIEKAETPKISEARRARNERYYEKNKSSISDKKKNLNPPIKTLSDAIKTVKTPVKTPKTPKTPQSAGKFLAKIGSPQYDAWNAYNRDRFGKGLPFSDKHNGWYVESEWPPGQIRGAAHRAGVR